MNKGVIIAAVAAVAIALYFVFARPATAVSSAQATSPLGAGGLLGANSANNPLSAFSAGLAGLETALNPNRSSISPNGTTTITTATSGAGATQAYNSLDNVLQSNAAFSSNLGTEPADINPIYPTLSLSNNPLENSNQSFSINNPVVPASSPISTSLSTTDLSDEDIMSLVGGNPALSFQSGSLEPGDVFSGISGNDLLNLEG